MLNLPCQIKRDIFKTQVILIVSITLLLGMIANIKTAFSFGLGGISHILPSVLFAICFFRLSLQQPKKMLNAFFYGAALKWLLMVGWLVAVFQWQGLHVLPFLAGLLLTQLGYWRALVKS